MRFVTRCLVAVGVGMMVVSSLLTPAAAPERLGAQTPTSAFGVNGHVASRFGIYGSQQAPLDVMAAHNVSWNREEFRWDMVQPAPNRWDWGFTDEMVDKATRRGVNILGLLAYSVGWASPGAGVGSNQPAYMMPANLDAYRAYVHTVVSRYKGRVRAWEVWNEPNHGAFWRPAPNASEYGTLLRVASEAIRAADPSARVVLGGVSGSDIAFLEQTVAVAGWQSFDVLAAHPYVAPKSPEFGYLADGELTKLQAFVNRHGGGKPIWLTEIGWPSSTPGQWGVGSAETQANYLVRGFVQAAASPGVERVFWYNWRNDGNDPNNDENNYGLVANNWNTAKPGAAAFRALTQLVDGAGAPTRLDLTGGPRAVINDFEQDAPWQVWGDGAGARASRSTEQRRGGAASARIDFWFSNSGKAYVDVKNEREAPGQPTTLGVWVNGDSSGHLLWATFRDADGEHFRVALGAIGTGWQLRQAWLANFETSDGDGVIQYPIRFQSLIVDNEPDGANGQGTIYLDDLFVEEGPAVYGYRFNRGESQVDVLWSATGQAGVTLPTASANGRLIQRDGNGQDIGAVNGAFHLTVGEQPIYVEHVAPGAGAVIESNGFTHESFARVWRETDQPVAEQVASRTWYWGPAPWLARAEPYAQSPGGMRQVQYLDKSRMEITRPDGDQNDRWHVTNGLLVKEMVSGQLQIGDLSGQMEQRAAAAVPVVGDADKSNQVAPTYASFANLASLDNDRRAPNRLGQQADQRVDRAGELSGAPANLLDSASEFVTYEETLGHNIPRVFWDFMHESGPVMRDGQLQHGQLVDWVFAFGLPITEPYWTRARVGGVERDVLVQLFERRVLTYTPGNPPGWQIEMGNVGQHYYQWRYDAAPWNR